MDAESHADSARSPGRHRVLAATAREPRCCNQLATDIGRDYKTVEKHLERLVDAGIVYQPRDERGAVYAVSRSAADHWEQVRSAFDDRFADEAGVALPQEPVAAGDAARLWTDIRGDRGSNRTDVFVAVGRERRNRSDLQKTLGVDHKTVQHHLDGLEDCDLVEPVVEGAYGTHYALTERGRAGWDVARTVLERRAARDADRDVAAVDPSDVPAKPVAVSDGVSGDDHSSADADRPGNGIGR